jgi:hypothetical protein
MKKLLLVLVLIAVAVSGCMEKSPSGTGTIGAEKNVGDIKTLSIKSADNLSSYSMKSSVTQTMKLNAVGINATPENATIITESTETIASVNLSGYQASASSSSKKVVELLGKATNSSKTQLDVYQIGNSTYIKDQNGRWTHILDPRSAEAIWGQGNDNKVKTLAEMINKSPAEIVGSENIEGIDTYKLKIINGSADYDNLYNTAIGIAAQLTQYPKFMPFINRTELNKTGVMEILVWISKDTYLPVKYQSSIGFKMTPFIVGSMDSKTGQMKRFNQSVRLGEVSVDLETTNLYYDFNKSVEINPPEEALEIAPISSAKIQGAPKA